MVTPRPPFLSEADLDDLEGYAQQGYATLQAWHRPGPITLGRRNAGGTFVDNATFTPIVVRFDQRMEQQRGQNAGMVEVADGGSFLAYAPLDVRRDDRFAFNGATCVVTRVHPEKRGGVIQVDFRMLGG